MKSQRVSKINLSRGTFYPVMVVSIFITRTKRDKKIFPQCLDQAYCLFWGRRLLKAHKIQTYLSLYCSLCPKSAKAWKLSVIWRCERLIICTGISIEGRVTLRTRPQSVHSFRFVPYYAPFSFDVDDDVNRRMLSLVVRTLACWAGCRGFDAHRQSKNL